MAPDIDPVYARVLDVLIKIFRIDRPDVQLLRRTHEAGDPLLNQPRTMGGPGLDFQTWETSVGENESPQVEVHRIPHLKIEMWATHRYWPDMGDPPKGRE
jgi:hypothetical protein